MEGGVQVEGGKGRRERGGREKKKAKEREGGREKDKSVYSSINPLYLT